MEGLWEVMDRWPGNYAGPSDELIETVRREILPLLLDNEDTNETIL